MSKVDTAWLRMDSPSNLMMILGVWVLKPGIHHEAVCARVSERLLPIARFRQVAVEDAAGATWVEDTAFDLRQARETAERETILAALARANGNIQKTSELLGVSRPTLYDLIGRLNIRVERA